MIAVRGAHLAPHAHALTGASAQGIFIAERLHRDEPSRDARSFCPGHDRRQLLFDGAKERLGADDRVG